MSKSGKNNFSLLDVKTYINALFSVKHPAFKVGLSPSKRICVICSIESPLKMMKNTFYLFLNALFVLKIFKILSRLFGHVGKTSWLER